MNVEEFYKITGLPRVQSIQKNYPLFDYNDLMEFAEDFHTHQKNSEWKPYPKERPADYGKYEVYRAGCDKQHYETWNNTGWAYNNRDITHWRPIVKPPFSEILKLKSLNKDDN